MPLRRRLIAGLIAGAALLSAPSSHAADPGWRRWSAIAPPTG
ncbi:hypothetical protein ACFQU2_23400 [Siccirubricoccus deserti]